MGNLGNAKVISQQQIRNDVLANKQKIKPGHQLNDTAEEAFAELDRRIKRKLVRRKFLYSIATAWIITVPASALMSATIYFILSKLTSMA